jgi:pyruvate/2-oxoglutarate/acetoin dehydrogenase E1 component
MKYLTVAAMMLITTGAFAWDGYNNESGSSVEIGAGNLVRPGQDIEVYDYSTGNYKEVEVQSINGAGTGAEVEVYDSESGEYETYDME